MAGLPRLTRRQRGYHHGHRGRIPARPRRRPGPRQRPGPGGHRGPARRPDRDRAHRSGAAGRGLRRPPPRRCRPAHARALRQPARQRSRDRPGGPRPGRTGRPGPRRLDRPVGLVRHHGGRPDHAEDHAGRSARRRGSDGRRRLLPGRHGAVPRVGAQRRLPRRAAAVGQSRSHPGRRHRPVRRPQALAPQRRPLAAGLRRLGPRSSDRGRGGGRRRLPRVDAAVVDRGLPPHRPACGRARQLPRSPARPVRQPPDAPPARPDRRRRLPEAPGPDPARPARRTRRRTDARAAPPARWGRGSATCAEPGPRSGSASTTCIPTGWCRSRRARCPTRSAECWTASTPPWEPTTTW